jgi:hypothetical protein
VAQPIHGGRGQQPVIGKGLIPFLEVEVAGDYMELDGYVCP